MAKKVVDPIVAVIAGALRRAWEGLRKKYPGEQWYAFGVYTTPDASYCGVFACGENGLKRVAEQYVKKGVIYKTVEEGIAGLRWSIPDSYYQRELSEGAGELESVFDGAGDIWDLPEAKFAREVHRRMKLMAEAIKTLDAEGLFGSGEAREKIVLLIEAGDRDDEWVEKWAKGMNPAKVFAAWKKRDGEAETIGTFTEFGTKKVYRTNGLSVNGDRSLIAAATDQMFFVFGGASGTGPLKQLAGGKVKVGKDCGPVQGVSLSADGSVMAAHADGPSSKAGWLAWVTGKEWEEQRVVKLKKRGMSMVMDPKGRWAAVGEEGKDVQIHLREGGEVRLLKGHKEWVRGLAVSGDGKGLVSADGNVLIVWDTATWKALMKVKDEGETVDIDENGERVVSTCRFGTLDEPKAGDRATLARVYRVKTGKVEKDVSVAGFSIAVAAFSPSGKELACGVERLGSRAGNAEAALVEIKSGRVVQRLKADFESVEGFAFLPERGEIAVAVFGHTRRPLVLWKVGQDG